MGARNHLTVKAAASLLGVSESTLRRWHKSGTLVAARHPKTGRLVYQHADVLAYARGDAKASRPATRGASATQPDAPRVGDDDMVGATPAAAARSRRTASASGRLLGRDAEICALLKQLDARPSVLTILGPPGVGKTALARRVVELAAPPDVAWMAFCDLSEITTKDELMQVVAREIAGAVNAPPGEGDINGIGQALARSGRVWVILDNFEQLIPEGVSCIERWLEIAEDSQFVFTSRAATEIAGEVLFSLTPLALPDLSRPPVEQLRADACALFLEIARASAPEFAPDDREIEVLAHLVTLLDGLPLAIELVATQMSVHPIDDLLEQLQQDPHPLLKDASTSRRPRSLHRALASSWDRLDESETALLRGLCVFRGGATFHAIERILGQEAREVVHQLHHKSWVHISADEEDREARVFLLQSIRRFLEPHLSDRPELDAIRQRHGHYYVALVKPWCEEQFFLPIGTPGSLLKEQLNLRGAIEWALTQGPEHSTFALEAALALHTLLFDQGGVPFRQHLLRVCLNRIDLPREHPLRQRAELAWNRSRMEQGGEASLEAEFIALAEQQCVDPGIPAYACSRISGLALRRGALREAVEWGHRGLEHIGDRNLARIEGLLRAPMWVIAMSADEAAATAHRERMEILARIDPVVEVDTLRLRALELVREQSPLATELLQTAIHLARQRGIVPLESICLEQLSAVLLEAGRLDEALNHAHEAIQLSQHCGRVRGETLAGGLTAMAYQERGDLVRARNLFEEVHSQALHLDLVRFAAIFELQLAAVLSELGSWELAQSWLARYEERQFVETLFMESSELVRSMVALATNGAHDEESRTHGRDLAQRALGHGKYAPASDAATRMLARVLLRMSTRDPQPSGSTVNPVRSRVQIQRDLRWVRFDGESPIDFVKRPTLRRLLGALVEHRIAHGKTPMTRELLVAEIWPKADATSKNAKSRLRVALHTIRSIGVRGVIEHNKQGFLLSPDVDIDFED